MKSSETSEFESIEIEDIKKVMSNTSPSLIYQEPDTKDIEEGGKISDLSPCVSICILIFFLPLFLTSWFIYINFVSKRKH